MKKYYCPYCGHRTLWIGQKLNIGITYTNFHNKCSSCGNKVALKSRWINIIVFVSMCITLILAIVFSSPILLSIFILLYIAYDVASILFSKFVTQEGTCIPKKEYTGTFQSSQQLKFPKIFFEGNSVLEIEYDGNKYPVNIRLANDNTVVFSFINIETELELSRDKVIFYDGEIIIGECEIK